MNDLKLENSMIYIFNGKNNFVKIQKKINGKAFRFREFENYKKEDFLIGTLDSKYAPIHFWSLVVSACTSGLNLFEK
tara:strand:+ start:356 stop:586 length:231 start_codon:yes stop_codon:yes gene_type:complete